MDFWFYIIFFYFFKTLIEAEGAFSSAGIFITKYNKLMDFFEKFNFLKKLFLNFNWGWKSVFICWHLYYKVQQINGFFWKIQFFKETWKIEIETKMYKMIIIWCENNSPNCWLLIILIKIEE
jgi:hypothetical protein